MLARGSLPPLAVLPCCPRPLMPPRVCTVFPAAVSVAVGSTLLPPLSPSSGAQLWVRSYALPCVRALSTAPDWAAALTNNHPRNNIPESVKSRVGLGLHRQPAHPLAIIKTRIGEHFATPRGEAGASFKLFDDLSPIVTAKQNFDDLLTPADHVSRRATDTFYLTDDTLLRTHTRCVCVLCECVYECALFGFPSERVAGRVAILCLAVVVPASMSALLRGGGGAPVQCA